MVLLGKGFIKDFSSLFEYEDKKYSLLSFLLEKISPSILGGYFREIINKIIKIHGEGFFKMDFHENILFWMINSKKNIPLIKHIVKYVDLDVKYEGYDIFQYPGEYSKIFVDEINLYS